MKKISEVSALAGVSKRTLQYYDEVGLLVAERSSENDRIYSEKAVETLIRILIYKSEGLKLEEIKEVLSLSCEKQNEYLTKHIENLSRKREDLEKKLVLANYIVNDGIAGIEGRIVNNTNTTIKEQIESIKREICVK